MNKELLTPIILSVLRHVLAVSGCALFFKEHESEFVSLSALLVAGGSVLWGALTAKSNHEQKEVLKEDKEILAGKVEAAKSETEVLKRIIAPDGGNLKLP